MNPITLLADTEILPDALQFLHVGWWIVHVIAIPVVFLIGYAVGKSKAAKPPGA